MKLHQELSDKSELDIGNSSEDDEEGSKTISKDVLSSGWSDPGSSKAGGSWSLGPLLRPILPSDGSSSDSSLEISPGKHKIPDGCLKTSEVSDKDLVIQDSQTRHKSSGVEEEKVSPD